MRVETLATPRTVAMSSSRSDGRRDPDLEDVVLVAGDRVALLDLRHRVQPLGDVVGGRRVERRDRDERGHLLAEGRVVELGRVALDDAALLEPPDPLVHGGGRHAQGLAEVGEADPAVLGEEVDDATVEVFHVLRVVRASTRTGRARPVGVVVADGYSRAHAGPPHAPGLRLAVLPRLLRRARPAQHPGRDPDQRAARLPRHDRHLVTAHRPDPPRRLLGRRLAAAVAGRPGADLQDAPAGRGLRRRRGEPRRPDPAGARSSATRCAPSASRGSGPPGSRPTTSSARSPSGTAA